MFVSSSISPKPFKLFPWNRMKSVLVTLMLTWDWYKMLNTNVLMIFKSYVPYPRSTSLRFLLFHRYLSDRRLKSSTQLSNWKSWHCNQSVACTVYFFSVDSCLFLNFADDAICKIWYFNRKVEMKNQSLWIIIIICCFSLNFEQILKMLCWDGCFPNIEMQNDNQKLSVWRTVVKGYIC